MGQDLRFLQNALKDFRQIWIIDRKETKVNQWQEFTVRSNISPQKFFCFVLTLLDSEGPADGGSAQMEQAPIIKPWKVYPPIQVRRDCDEDDPEAHLSKSIWVQVKLTLVAEIDFTLSRDGRIVEGPAPCQAINLAVHNAMLGRMLALEKGPKVFYFNRSNLSSVHLMLPVHQYSVCCRMQG